MPAGVFVGKVSIKSFLLLYYARVRLRVVVTQK